MTCGLLLCALAGTANVAEAQIAINPDAVSVQENQTNVVTMTATPSFFAAFDLLGGDDQTHFSISNSGVLTFNAPPDFEMPADLDRDNVYLVVVRASNIFGQEGTQTVAVTVTNVLEPPVITSNDGGATAAISVPENQIAVTTVTATSSEPGALSFSITGGIDGGDFSIDGSSGVLTFDTPPDFETPTDNNSNNVYRVVVTATGAGGTDAQEIFVTVTDVADSAPVITSNGGGDTAAISVTENQTAVTTVTATNPGSGAVTFSLTGGADQARFAIDSAGALTFVAAPDFENPTDFNTDNRYIVVATATNANGSDSQTITVNVNNAIDTPPSIGGGPTASISVAENQAAVTTVTATNPEPGPVTFSLTGGADQARFAIGGSNGMLRFVTAPDFESPADVGANNTYEVQVTATASGGATSQLITVTVTNVTEPPVIGGGPTAAVSVAENQTAVTTVTATNPEPGAVTFSLTGGADQARFTIGGGSGVLTFVAAPDFENPVDVGANNTYIVVVTATGAGGTDSQTITVTVTNVNESPVITSNGGGPNATISIPENQTAVTTVTATNPLPGAVTFSLTGGPDQARFAIGNTNGVLTFVTAPDFENPVDIGANNTYIVVVTATGTGGTDSQTITVTVTNIDDVPVITSNGGGPTASISMPENRTAVTTVTATNPAPGAITFSLTGGADQAAFAIGSTTGVLTFVTAPDFENPVDIGANNTYVVNVTVTGGGGTDSQIITVAVTNANDDEIDVSHAVTVAPTPASVNAVVTWQFFVSNPHPTLGVDALTLSAAFSETPFTFTNTGSCTPTGQALACNVGPIPPNGSATVTVTGQATQAGDVIATSSTSNVRTAFGPAVDPNPANDTVITVLNVGQSLSTGPAQAIPVTGTPTAAATGDLDGDGFTDLIVGSSDGNGTRVYFSVPTDPADPAGTAFRRLSTAPVSLGDTANRSRDALLVDLDADQDLDLVLANGAAGNPQANTVFRNDRAGGQATFVATATLGNQISNAAAAADLDGNGLPDLVFANSSPNEVFLNQGGGTFVQAPSLGNADSRAVVVADFDGDSLPDLVFANSGGPSHGYRGLGGGQFAVVPVDINAGPAVSVQAADFSGDGRLDLVFGTSGAPGKSLFVNTSPPGALSFSGPLAALGTSPALKLVAADFTLDGITDIVALSPSGTHQIFVGAANSVFTLHPEQFSSAWPNDATVGDFNNDGRVDLAIVGTASIELFLNDGRGNLGRGDITPPVVTLSGTPSVTLNVGDTYTDAGATAVDDIDGNVNTRIVVTNPVDTAVIGTYTVTYNATDRSGNKAVPVSRTVAVGARTSSGGGGGGAIDMLTVLALVLTIVLSRLLKERARYRA